MKYAGFIKSASIGIEHEVIYISGHCQGNFIQHFKLSSTNRPEKYQTKNRIPYRAGEDDAAIDP